MSVLVGARDLGLQRALRGGGSTAAAAVTAEHEREHDREDSPGERPSDVDPIVGEVERHQVGPERTGGIHRCARDRAAPQAGQCDVTADADRTDDADVLRARRGAQDHAHKSKGKVAQRLAKQWWIEPPHPDLAYLVEGTPEFTRYIRELRWAPRFALLNREEMMDRVANQLGRFLGAEVEERERINCHHNFTESEMHFGKRVWVSGKGAIQADEGRLGLIPGSMGTASYVVEGKGNPLSLNSSPHGAGREHSRSAARRTFTHEQLREAMVGIEYRDTDAFIDEIPQAYKPIDQVMADAADLVTVRHTLRQLVNVKGD